MRRAVRTIAVAALVVAQWALVTSNDLDAPAMWAIAIAVLAAIIAALAPRLGDNSEK